MDKDDAERRTLLSKNAYSPKMLADELHLVVSEETIRRAVRKGKLKARRLGGRYIVILRTDAEEWLNRLSSRLRDASEKARDDDGRRTSRTKH